MTETAEVRLVPFTVAEVEGLADGTIGRRPCWHPEFPGVETVAMARLLLDTYAALATYDGGSGPGEDPVWWLLGVVEAGQLVGHVGFHGPPPVSGPAEVEVGYQVVPSCRGRGLATAACAQLLAYAWAHGAQSVGARADQDNLASRAVLRANGFEATPSGDFTASAPIRERAWTA